MKTILLYAIVLLCLMTETLSTSAAADDGGAADAVILDESDLTESSGLAISQRQDNRFWSHNDSGGKPRIYAFDQRGRRTGKCELQSIELKDWEDIASFTDDDVARLLVADCGDNLGKRDSIVLYLMDEPDPDKSIKTKKFQTISVTYPDGPHDCEAVAVDPRRRQIVLITKSRLAAAGVYVIPLPARDDRRDKVKVTARRVAALPLPMVTAMDMDPLNGNLWVISYFQAFRFARVTRDEPLNRQLSRLPVAHELPRWRQIEGVAVDRLHRVWVTSEGSPARMGRLPRIGERAE